MLKNLVGNTPLIELSSGILVKLETYNPTGSIKDRIISYIVRKAVESKEIKPGMTLVEATSGNTGIALSAMGSHIGHKVKIIMPSNMSEERKQMMRLFGAEIVEVAPHDFKGAITLRDQMVKEGCWSPNQFENELNIECHFKTTADEIHRELQTAGEVWGAFVSGAGTGGTMMGIQKYVEWRGLGTQLIFMKPAEKEHGIQGVGDGGDYLLDQNLLTHTVEIKTQDAVKKSKSLSKQLGIPIGISGAANVLAAEWYEKNHLIHGKTVTILCDRGERYMSNNP